MNEQTGNHDNTTKTIEELVNLVTELTMRVHGLTQRLETIEKDVFPPLGEVINGMREQIMSLEVEVAMLKGEKDGV